MTRIAFIGFGEAAQAMASGLRGEERLSSVAAFDLPYADLLRILAANEPNPASAVRGAAA